MERSIFLPEGFSRSYRYPLILWLCRTRDERLRSMKWMHAISERNYVGISVESGEEMLLDLSRDFWNHDMIELFSLLPVHRGRIYVAGVEYLGELAYRLMASSCFKVAGAISLGSDLPGGFLSKVLSKKNLTAHDNNEQTMRLFWMPRYAPASRVIKSPRGCRGRSPFWMTQERSLEVESRLWSEINLFVMHGIYRSG